MIIHARTSPIELILYVHVWDEDGHLIPRVVYLDTEKMVAQQYLRSDDSGSSLHEVSVGSFEFRATTQMPAEALRALLPSELRDKVVSTKT